MDRHHYLFQKFPLPPGAEHVRKRQRTTAKCGEQNILRGRERERGKRKKRVEAVRKERKTEASGEESGRMETVRLVKSSRSPELSENYEGTRTANSGFEDLGKHQRCSSTGAAAKSLIVAVAAVVQEACHPGRRVLRVAESCSSASCRA